MKKEIRILETIIKTAPGLKAQIIFSAILLLVGLLCEFLSSSNLSCMILITNSGLFFYQSIMTASGSGIAQSSASAKKLQTTYPFYIQIPMYIIIFFIISIHRLYIVSMPLPDVSLEDSYAQHGTLILGFSILCINIMILEILFSKHVILGLIFMLTIFFPAYIFANMFDEFFKISMNSAIALGFLIIIAGSLLAILTANLLYKYPISAHMMKENTKS